MSWMFEMGSVRNIHLVGIGGVGMAGIAEVLLQQGYTVTGSDPAENACTLRLKNLGAIIFHTHHEKNIENAHVIVRSTAVKDSNVELVAARQHQIPVVARAEMLGELMRFRYGIAIAGTHGKTTTTSLITSIFAEASLDPTFVIGGRLNSVGTNARLGSGRYLIAEACESDASFLFLNPMISVVTNIDEDHMATYNNDFAELKSAFLKFLHRLPFYGMAVLCIDDPVIKEILPQIARPVVTYGFSEGADYQATSYLPKGMKTEFVVKRPGNYEPLEITLNMPGKHNVLNTLAAIAIATELNIPSQTIYAALTNFAGIGRRFQVYGNYSLDPNRQFTLIDDYGHHPREIAATYQAAKDSWPSRRIVMVYQPHRYTRTRDLYEEFCKVLALPDHLLLLEVYAAGEEPIAGADASALIAGIKGVKANSNASLVASTDDILSLLNEVVEDGDIVLMQGAGNIGALAANLAQNNLKKVS